MIIKKFEEQVERSPNKIVVKSGNKFLTYRELSHHADRIANAIIMTDKKEETEGEQGVALLFEHGLHMIAGVIGTLKAGRRYIPFDISYPVNRLVYMLENSGSLLILTDNKYFPLAENLTRQIHRGTAILNIERISDESPAVNRVVSGDRLAYILYTSGSTGRPKGVAQTQRNVLYYIRNWVERFSITSADRMTLFSAFSHDGAGQDMFAALLTGACLYPYSIKIDSNSKGIYHLLKEEKITIWHSVPSLFRYFAGTLTGKECFNDIRWVLLGGEPIRAHDLELFKTHFPKATLANVYGQTESSVTSICQFSQADTFDSISLGEPLDETEIILVNEAGDVIGDMGVGEIVVASDYIAPGYWQDEAASEAVFIRDDELGGLYRTGDVGRLTGQGTIKIMGRKDYQVKIRGFRVETGEIETTLLKIPGIKETAVISKEAAKGNIYLVAFIAAERTLNAAELRTFLSGELPDYMVPTQFVQVEKMPLTQSGKVDRKFLAALEKEPLKTKTSYADAETGTERIIANAWKEVLNREEVGIHDNLFELGGNSFDIVKISNQLTELLHVDIPIVKFFEYPTIGDLARYLDQLEGDKNTGQERLVTGKTRRKRGISEKIAVIGMAGRFPGAKNIEEFWENLKNGRESIVSFSDEELIESGLPGAVLGNPNYIKAKGVLEDIDFFDASFFNFSVREAELLDPQLRIFLECAWEALENAGYTASDYDGLIGVYAGNMQNNAWSSNVRTDQGANSGLDIGFVTNHFSTYVSYKLNLTGPCIFMRTACSTSLVTVHLACGGLALYECDMALAGGVSLSLPGKTGYLYQEGMILSADGCVRAFDANSTGTVFGDGMGCVVLKRLDEARADGDNIYAVIRGSAINNDGMRKVGFTAPSVTGQREVVQTAQLAAGVAAESISFIETHGTATRLGDAVEIEALRSLFPKKDKKYCALASVKSNVGHLNAAAGVTGLIKTVLSLSHRMIPPSLHFEIPNPQLDLGDSPFYVNTRLSEWKNNGYPLRAGVSSFGIGGTNAHVVLEEAVVESRQGADAGKYRLILLSAKTQAALDRLTVNLIEYLEKNPSVDLADIAYTLQVGREFFEYRKAAVCANVKEAAAALKISDPGTVQTFNATERDMSVVYMFPGQGQQYVDMGLDLYREVPVFREEMDRCFEILAPLVDFDLRHILYPGAATPDREGSEASEEWIFRQDVTQPLMFSFEYALARLMMKWGIKPGAMIGYSIGEYVAACLADVFSLEDALKLVAARGKFMQEIPCGTMLNVPLSEDQLKPMLTGDVEIAVVNGPSCIVAGTDQAIAVLEQELKRKECLSMRLNISHAGHSRMMDPMMARFEEKIRQVKLHKPVIPYISNVTGTWITPEQAVDPHYWARQLREAVRFSDGVSELLKRKNVVFVELGPARNLLTTLHQHKDKRPDHYFLYVLRYPQHKVSDLFYMLEKIGRLWLYGIRIDWSGVYPEEKRTRIPLPTYPFEGLRFRSPSGPVLRGAKIGEWSPAPALERTGTESAEAGKPGEEGKTLFYSRPKLTKPYVEPRTEIERKLAKIWKNFFGFQDLGIDDDFFELGGDSLKATTIIAWIHGDLGVVIPLAEVFKRQTIRGLSEYLSEARETAYASVDPLEEREYYALSSAQKRLYFLQLLDLNSTSYNMPLITPLEKGAEKDKIEMALRWLIQRHESLRTSFVMLNKDVFQEIHPAETLEFSLDYYEADEKEAKKIITGMTKPFDLSQAPLIRSILIKLADGRQLWGVDVHHIISDGTSHTILTEDFLSLYHGIDPEPLRLQYKDFARWQNGLFASGAIQAQKDYWFDLLAGELPRLNLPTDYKRPESFTFAGDSYGFWFDKEDAEKFKAMSLRNGGTLYMNMLAALNTLFYKYSGQNDIIIGTVIAGRKHVDLQGVVGMFVNTLTMRNYPAGEMSYEAFGKEVIANSVRGFENQDLQFENLVDELVLERDLSRNPLFDIMMVVQNFRKVARGEAREKNSAILWEDQLPTAEGNSSSLRYKNTTSKFDMTFYVYEQGGNIFIGIEYYTAIFKRETIRRFSRHLKNLVKAVVTNPALTLDAIDITSEEEKKTILWQFNETGAPFPREKTIVELFEEKVEYIPDNMAVVGGDESLTYKVLEEESNRVAHYLVDDNKVRPGDFVGVWMDRSPQMIIALFGILKAGGAYVPLDPALPPERIKYMIEDASIGLIISEKNLIKDLNRLQWECGGFHRYLCMDSRDLRNEDEPDRSELMNEELWDHVGQTGVDEITGGGWVSSYTGEPMSTEEMDEYADNILKKLEPVLHPGMRVLEIGCASGITMFRLAPKVGFYYGTDLSAVIIERNKQRVEKEGHRNIKLSSLAAHEIDRLEEGNFDLVIMNSVIYCFSGHNYLTKVVRKAINLLGETGLLFIGDILDQQKKDALVKDLVNFKRANRDKHYTTKTDFSAELFISRGFWEDLAADMAEIETLEFSDKIHTIENELTKFRYDLLLRVDKRVSPVRKRKKRKSQDDRNNMAGFSGQKAPIKFPSHNPAYLIYTSGSTGRPKGAIIQHQSVVNVLSALFKSYPLRASDAYLLKTSIMFDVSVSELFGWYWGGGRLSILEKDEQKDPWKILEAVSRFGITHINFVPSMFNLFLEVLDPGSTGGLSGLKYIFLAGEALLPELVNKFRCWQKNIKLENLYGPTEGTVYVSGYSLSDWQGMGSIPIGKPLQNICLYILDRIDRWQPVGVVGELYIGGEGVGRGYINNPELTCEKFDLDLWDYRDYHDKKRLRGNPGVNYKQIPNPKMQITNQEAPFGQILNACGEQFSERTMQDDPQGHNRLGLPAPPPGRRRQKFYRTGDLARWREDGNIEFLGRIDHQVKIRGFRVEIGEIENQVLKYPEIKECVVLALEDESGDKRLCAYFVPARDLAISELREYLSRDMPEYMVPAYFVSLEAIPLTPSGKLNRKALPEPGFTAVDGDKLPRNEREQKLVEIWSQVLGIEKNQIGIDSNFFELGGHSLKATIMVTKIHKEMNVKVPLSEVFKSPNIKNIAAYIKIGKKDKFTSITPAEKKEYYPLSSAQKRLLFVQQLNPRNALYNMLQMQKLERTDNEKLEAAFEKLIKRHDNLRTSFQIIDDVGPIQKIHDDATFKIEYHSPALGLKNEELQLIARNFKKPFDLGKAPLMRVAMIKTGSEEYLLLVDIHHIISDAVSQGVLAGDFMAIYDGRELPSLKLQYKDYSEWQNGPVQKNAKNKQREYWLREFSGEIPVLNLPLDYQRNQIQHSEGTSIHFTLGREDTVALKKMALEEGTTLYFLLFALFNTFLSKITGQEDIIIVTPEAGRKYADLEEIIGMFVNTIPLRNFPKDEKIFVNFLEDVKNRTLAAFENQDFQFEDIVSLLRTKKSSDRNTLLDVGFGFLQEEDDREGISVEESTDSPPQNYQLNYETSQVDLSLYGTNIGEKTSFEFGFATKLFKKETGERFVSYFLEITSQVLENKYVKLRDIHISHGLLTAKKDFLQETRDYIDF